MRHRRGNRQRGWAANGFVGGWLLRGLEKLREIVARRLDVRVCEPDNFQSIAAGPGLVQLRVLLSRALYPTRRQKVHTNVPL